MGVAAQGIRVLLVIKLSNEGLSVFLSSAMIHLFLYYYLTTSLLIHIFPFSFLTFTLTLVSPYSSSSLSHLSPPSHPHSHTYLPPLLTLNSPSYSPYSSSSLSHLSPLPSHPHSHTYLPPLLTLNSPSYFPLLLTLTLPLDTLPSPLQRDQEPPQQGPGGLPGGGGLSHHVPATL